MSASFQVGHRRHVPELMDQPGLGRAEHARALQGLRRVNALSGTAARLWRSIGRLSRESGDGPVRVLDLACGGGDVALALARKARATGRAVEVDGCDLSAQAVRLAEDKAGVEGLAVGFFVHDALAGPLPEGYDVVTCTLFLHHLGEQDAVELLRKAGAAAKRLVLVDDLIRTRLGYALAVVGCHLLSGSRVVRYDGPASVAGAFSLPEVGALAERAGLSGASIATHWPQRFLLSWMPR